jgi:replicative DNA helicase
MKGKIKITPAHESECTVIGAMILDCQLFPIVKEHLCKNDFYYSKHKRIFHVMGELWNKHNKFDAAMIVDQIDYLKDGVLEEEVYGLANDCPSLKNVRSHVDIIREKSVQRQLIQVATEIAEEASNPKTANIKEILDRAEESVMNLSEAYGVNICPYQHRLACYLREFAEEIANTDLTEDYLHECIVEVNKAFISTLEHVEGSRRIAL